MPIDLSARDRRALTLGAIVLAPLILWRLVLAPGADELTRVRAAVAAERATLARELALLASASERSLHADALVRRLVTYTPRLFQAGAAPEAHVREIAGASNVAVRSIERIVSPDQELIASSVVHPVGLRVDGESDLEGVLSLLGALDTDELLFVVESLDLSHQAPVDSRAPEILRLEMRVRAFVSGANLSLEDVP